MKLNLDCEPKDMGVALNVAFSILSQNPVMDEGSKGAIVQEVNGITFMLTKNQDSFTIEAVE